MGSQLFLDVQVPLLWGTRAVIQDGEGKLSIIDLSGSRPVLEVVEDEPAKGVAFSPRLDGFVVIGPDGAELYKANPTAKTITGIALQLPPVTIGPDSIHVGRTTIRNNTISGVGVGIHVTETSISLGGPLPPGLAALRV